MLKLLSNAIKAHRCVAIRYRGQNHIRVIEPHCLYKNERGEFIVDGYQTRGYSGSGRPTPFWRPFRLKKIDALSVMSEKFKTRWTEGFNKNKLKYNNVLAVVEDKEAKHLYAEKELMEMGPFLPNMRNR